jgi:uncharacterized BrkB/YihY/UPF0761 family membrane protein
VIKIVMTYTLPSLVKSPSGAAFGSVLGLMAFFYFFARLTLFCAAWIATASTKTTRVCREKRTGNGATGLKTSAQFIISAYKSSS